MIFFQSNARNPTKIIKKIGVSNKTVGYVLKHALLMSIIVNYKLQANIPVL